MAHTNPRPEIAAFVDGPLAQYVRRIGNGLYSIAVQNHTEQTNRGHVSPLRVDALILHMQENPPADQDLQQALELRGSTLISLQKDYYENPVLRKMAEDCLARPPDVAMLFFSGVSRFLFHRLEGKDADAALAMVTKGFKALFACGNHYCEIGATMLLNGVPADGIQLGPKVWLRLLSDSELHLAGLETSPLFTGSAKGNRPTQASWAAIVKSDVPRSICEYSAIIPWLRGPYLREIMSLVAFLQLEIVRDIRPGHLFMKNSEWLPNVFGFTECLSYHTGPYPNPRKNWRQRGVKITAEKATELKARWPLYEAAMNNGRFSLACSRYSYSLQRDTVEDSIIDHWIALEALFSKADNEISSNAASKMAILLGGNLDQRKATRRQVLQHYGIRSGLVHGAENIDKRFRRFQQTFAGNASRSLPENYASATSRKWVEQALKLVAGDPKILSELDDAILSGDLGFQRQVPGYWREKLRQHGVTKDSSGTTKNEGESGGDPKGQRETNGG